MRVRASPCAPVCYVCVIFFDESSERSIVVALCVCMFGAYTRIILTLICKLNANNGVGNGAVCVSLLIVVYNNMTRRARANAR